MLYQFLGHNYRLLKTIIHFLTILMFAGSGMSAVAAGIMPCNTGCCCNVKLPATHDKFSHFTGVSATTCCHGDTHKGLIPTHCQMPPSPKTTSMHVSLVAHDHTNLILMGEQSRNTDSHPILSLKSFQLMSTSPLLQKVPLYIQKSTLLC